MKRIPPPSDRLQPSWNGSAAPLVAPPLDFPTRMSSAFGLRICASGNPAAPPTSGTFSTYQLTAGVAGWGIEPPPATAVALGCRRSRAQGFLLRLLPPPAAGDLGAQGPSSGCYRPRLQAVSGAGPPPSAAIAFGSGLALGCGSGVGWEPSLLVGTSPPHGVRCVHCSFGCKKFELCTPQRASALLACIQG